MRTLIGIKDLCMGERSSIAGFNGFDPRQLYSGDAKHYILEYLIREGLASKATKSKIYDSPLRHEGSQALYYADYYHGADGEHRILLGVMPPDSRSTTHFHREPIIEEYHPLAGQLYLNKEPIPSRGLIVNPYTVHQASAGEIPAITLIIMKYAGSVPEHLQHI